MSTAQIRRIVLCGFMGCGKSSVGEALAAHLKWEFLDTDAMIEKRENCSVPDIFREKGEAYFRRLETEVAAVLSEKQQVVVSTGGGFVINQENIDTLLRKVEPQKEREKEETCIVYLDCDFETCYQRIKNSSRPLVKTKTKKELTELFEQRVQQYRKIATLHVSNQSLISDVVVKICEIKSAVGA